MRGRTDKKVSERKQIPVGKHLINYIVSGKGSPIVLIHGLGTSAVCWEKNLEALSECGRVFAIDLPGHGDSSPLSSLDFFGPEDYADIIYEWCREMKIRKFHLIGHSLGGEISLWFACKYPEMVKKMVLVASTCIKCEIPLQKRIINLLKNAPNESLWFLPKVIEAYGKAGGIRMLTTMLSRNPSGLLTRTGLIKTPALVIAGTRDTVVDLDESSELADLLPNSSLKLVDGGHGLIFSQPAHVNKAICKFLSSGKKYFDLSETA